MSDPQPLPRLCLSFSPCKWTGRAWGWVLAECSLRSAHVWSVLWKNITACTSDVKVLPVPQGKQRKEWSPEEFPLPRGFQALGLTTTA